MSGAEHAPLAPSAAHRWVNCPGSVRMCAQFPDDPDSPHAAEGTAAHWVWAEMLAGRNPVEGDRAPNGVPVTLEMLEGADLYHDAATTGGGWLHVEERVECPAVHADCWGTPDTWKTTADAVEIVDYKFGHRHVEVVGNWQLIAYAAGVCRQFGADADARVRLRIVQPRSYHRDGPVRTWETTVRELIPYWQRLREAAEAAMGPDAWLNTGDHCRDCSARHACPALQSAAMAWAEESMRGLPLELPPVALGLELRIVRTAIERLEARAKGLEAVAMATAPGGIPGWRVEQGAGRERWAVPLPEVLALGQMLGVDVSKPGAITPKQAIKAGIPADVVRQYSETPAGALKLVEDDGSLAARVFGGAA